jgi:hypothetical protein
MIEITSALDVWRKQQEPLMLACELAKRTYALTDVINSMTSTSSRIPDPANTAPIPTFAAQSIDFQSKGRQMDQIGFVRGISN